MEKRKQRRDPYEPVKVIFDSFESYEWFPVEKASPATPKKKRHHKTWRQRARQMAANILRHHERQKLADQDAERYKRAAELLAAVEKDKVLLALEKAFDERVQQIQRYYEQEHAKEKTLMRGSS